MDTQTWLPPVLTLLVGLLTGYLAEWHRDARVARREQESRRKQKQREIIIETQDSMAELFRINHEIHWAQKRYAEKAGEWPKSEVIYDRAVLLPAITLSLRLTMLLSRMEDEELARALRRFNKIARGAAPAGSSAAFDEAADKMTAAMAEFNRRATALLPSLH